MQSSFSKEKKGSHMMARTHKHVLLPLTPLQSYWPSKLQAEAPGSLFTAQTPCPDLSVTQPSREACTGAATVGKQPLADQSHQPN